MMMNNLLFSSFVIKTALKYFSEVHNVATKVMSQCDVCVTLEALMVLFSCVIQTEQLVPIW